MEFQKHFIIFVMIPLFDLYSSQVNALSKKNNEILETLLTKLLNIIKQNDDHSNIVLQWCIKSVNFELNDPADEESK